MGVAVSALAVAGLRTLIKAVINPAIAVIRPATAVMMAAASLPPPGGGAACGGGSPVALGCPVMLDVVVVGVVVVGGGVAVAPSDGPDSRLMPTSVMITPTSSANSPSRIQRLRRRRAAGCALVASSPSCRLLGSGNQPPAMVAPLSRRGGSKRVTPGRAPANGLDTSEMSGIAGRSATTIVMSLGTVSVRTRPVDVHAVQHRTARLSAMLTAFPTSGTSRSRAKGSRTRNVASTSSRRSSRGLSMSDDSGSETIPGLTLWLWSTSPPRVQRTRPAVSRLGDGRRQLLRGWRHDKRLPVGRSAVRGGGNPRELGPQRVVHDLLALVRDLLAPNHGVGATAVCLPVANEDQQAEQPVATAPSEVRAHAADDSQDRPVDADVDRVGLLRCPCRAPAVETDRVIISRSGSSSPSATASRVR